jgi:hypothetical protein
MTAHRQRRSNLVTGNLVDAISESGQLDALHFAGVAVVIFDPDHAEGVHRPFSGPRYALLGRCSVMGFAHTSGPFVASVPFAAHAVVIGIQVKWVGRTY